MFKPLTVHLKSVGLKQFFISISITGVVAHVGSGDLGEVQ